MEQRIRRILSLETELKDGTLAEEERRVMSDELSALLNVSIGDIPEYAVWRGDNKAELDAFISDCTELERSTVSTKSRASEMEYRFKVNGRIHCLRLLDVISNDGGFFRPTIEYPFRELDIVGKSVLFNGSESMKRRFREQTRPILSLSSAIKTYRDIDTGESVYAYPWTGTNVAEFKERTRVDGFRIENWGTVVEEDGNYKYGGAVHIVRRGKHYCELCVPVGGYLIRKRNPQYHNLNLQFGDWTFTSFSAMPEYIYESMGMEDFVKKYTEFEL